jgi:hypothetical protein
VAAIRDIGAYPRVKQALQRARYSEILAQLGRLAVDARDPQVLLQQVPAIAAQALQVECASCPARNEPARVPRASGVGPASPARASARACQPARHAARFVLPQGSRSCSRLPHRARFAVPPPTSTRA